MRFFPSANYTDAEKESEHFVALRAAAHGTAALVDAVPFGSSTAGDASRVAAAVLAWSAQESACSPDGAPADPLAPVVSDDARLLASGIAACTAELEALVDAPETAPATEPAPGYLPIENQPLDLPSDSSELALAPEPEPAPAPRPEPAFGVISAAFLGAGHLEDSIATYGGAFNAYFEAPAPAPADKYASKVWFLHGDRLLSYERSDSDPMKPQLCTFGGGMDAADAGSYATCAIREVSEEEIYVPAEWVGPFLRAVEANPTGQTVVQLTRRGVVHHVALWFVRLPASGAMILPQLRADGLREVRPGSMRWRPISEVYTNLDQFVFAAPHARAIRFAGQYAALRASGPPPGLG